LRPGTEQLDREIVGSLMFADRWDGVILNVFSWYEQQAAATHPLVQMAVQILRSGGKLLGWGRRHWVSYPNMVAPDVPRPTSCSYFDPAYHAAAISRVKAEAAMLGARWTVLDIEPYGPSPQGALKDAILTALDRQRIRRPIAEATEATGRVDIATPSGSNRETHYSYALREVASTYWCQKTYGATSVDTVPEIKTPPGVEVDMHWWGSNLGLADEIAAGGKYVTVDDVWALDWLAIKAAYPGALGVIAYVRAERAADVILASRSEA
jgi:hypothetical protein